MNTVGGLKDGISGMLQGLDLNNVTGLYKALERAARTLMTKADVPEASAKQAITLYNGVYDYTAPTNIFGGSLTDFRPQGIARNANDYVYKQGVEQFDRTKALLPNGYALTFETNKGVGIVRVASPKPTAKTTLDKMQETTDWTAGGSASGLAKDETVYYESPSSLRFTLTGSSTGTLTKTINQIDISDYEDVCVGFLAIRTPSTDNLTNISVRVGSSDANYDEVTETEGFLGAWVVGEWLLVAFDFSGATSTGTPDWNAIDYVQVRVAHTGTITNFYVGGFFLSLPSPHELHYQTAAIFLRSGALAKTITDDTDEIVLNDASYLLYEHECAVTIAEQASGGNLDGVALGYKNKLTNELYPNYEADNPSAEIRSIGSYL